jgi:3-oxoacyl-[acyl-carrier-protein] synthase II
LSKRRIVITGLGMVSPVGLNVADSWASILAGKTGITKITAFDASRYASQISGDVKDFDPTTYMDPKEVRRTDPFIHYALAACTQAMNNCGLVVTEQNAPRLGVAFGSGIGGLSNIQKSSEILEQVGPKRISPFFIPATIINMAAGHVSIKFGLKGPNYSIVTACTTGAHNIGMAMRTIQNDEADMMICGGSEMATCDLGVCGFSAMRALSTRNDAPEIASRPWDKDRDGFILGDGAGALVLEEYEHAKARGATIYAELAGFGMSADAFHMTAPDPDGGVRAMKAALKDGGVNANEINYVNAHATSTSIGDINEVKALKIAFGDHAYQLAVSSTKSMTGHLLGAAGAIEAIFTVMALRDQVAPPTMNLDTPDEGCDLNFVPNAAQPHKLTYCMSNSFGFGGTNGSLLFKVAE